MIRFLIKIGVFLIIGILIYNFFFGDNSEKAQSKAVFGEMRDVVVSVGDLMKSEKKKYDAGKYDEALDKLGDAYVVIRKQAVKLDQAMMEDLEDLEKRQKSLQKELDSIEKAEGKSGTSSIEQAARKVDLQREMESLLRDTDKLIREAQEQQ
ncbi:MAG: hypothetical protein IT270_07175 [Saprospiraceae bacterium]|nr:hypothetical protein [Saprospiraceae bacterium]